MTKKWAKFNTLTKFSEKYSLWAGLLFVSFSVLIGFLSNNSFLIPKNISAIGSSYFEVPPQIGALNIVDSTLQIVLIITYFVQVSIIGMGICIKIFVSKKIKKDKFFPYLLPLSGFLPGYLVNVGCFRVISMIFNQDISLYFWIFISIAVTIQSLRTVINQKIYGNFRKILITLITTMTLSVFFLINQLQVNLYAGLNIHIFGDATLQNIYWLDKLGGNLSTAVPIFSEHYDEIFFFLPLNSITSFLQIPQTYIVWFWLLYSIGKATGFALLLLLARSVIKTPIASFGLTALLFFSSLALNPLASPLLFDSGNNLSSTGHIGRVFTNIICLYTMVSIWNNQNLVQHNRNLYFFVVSFFLGAGITSLTFSLLFALLTLSVIRILKKYGKPIKYPLTHIVLLVILLTYFVPAASNFSGLIIGVYLGIFSVGVAISCWPQIAKILNELKQINPIILGIIAGNLFLGNLLTSHVIKWTNLLNNRIETRGIAGEMDFQGFGITQNPGQYPFGHLGNSTSFLIFFGFPILVIVLFIFVSKFELHLPDHQVDGLALHLVGLLLSFYILDYLNAGYTEIVFVWLKTRLVEPMFLMVIFKVFWLFDLWYRKSTTNGDLKYRVDIITMYVYLSIGLIGTIPGGPVSQFLSNLIEFCKISI
jgi:hypothetical protein